MIKENNYLDKIKEKLKSYEYNFLRENEHLGDNIIMLTVGGSYAYGTNVEGSDIDIRGCALNSKRDILTNVNFEQFINEKTDTTIYSFNKLISLLSNCNPNTIELLGNKTESYFYLSDIGRELLENADLFLSKKAAHSFGGYATAQLRRLDNKAARSLGQVEREKHILNSIKNAEFSFKDRYFKYPEDGIRLYLDDAIQENFDKEIFMDINLTHYPLRDYDSMFNEISNIVKDYNKLGKRNKNAIEHGKLGKHMMHLVRLYYMCFDILEQGKIVTYREKEHDLLMNIRNGKFLNDKNEPVSEFYEMVDELEERLKYAKENTSLPERPDYKRIEEFVMSVNERVIKERK